MSDLYKEISGSIGKDIDEDIEIRTGEITADNGDGTYDVKIANADSAMPNVETLDYGATFGISEIVVIGFEYGCKESPKILGSAKKIAQEPKIVEVDYSGGARAKTLNAYSITFATAYLNGEISITANIIGNCTRRGFHYGTDTEYGLDKYEDGSFGAGTYTLKIEGLTANTTYHYQAYVIDANSDEQVGGDKTMTTKTTKEKLIAVIVQQYSEDDYLKFYDLDGNLQSSYLLGNGIVYFETDCMAMDVANNVYYIKNGNYLTKIDSSGNELLSTAIAGYPESIAMGADGYLYTREQDGKVHKRKTSDFSSQGYITLTDGKSYYGLVLDENNNIFTVNATDDEIEKWSSAGVKVASRSVADGGQSSLCLAPNENYIIRVRNRCPSEIFRINKDLGSNEANYSLYHIDNYPHATSSVGSMYLFTGENSSYNCELEVHKWGGVEWYAIVDDSEYSPDNSLVAAYPF